MRRNWRLLASLVAVLTLLLTACGTDDDSAAQEAPAAEVGDSEAADEDAAGTVEIDGSSTVGPLTDAIAEEYAPEQPDTTVNVGTSGTGGGFERFCGTGDTDISNASRAIEDDERAACEEAGIEFVEVRVGTDALTMVTHPEAEGLECLTIDEIKRFWSSQPAPVNNWSEVNPQFLDEEIQIFAPGVDSGTYDFFNETVLGDPEEGAPEPRRDYNASEDDNIIAQGVEGTPYSFGFFGFAYYTNNVDALQPIAFDNGEGCVQPSVETAESGEYGLSRPLYIYVKAQSLQEKPFVADFVNFYLDTVDSVIQDVGYVPAPDSALDDARTQLEAVIAGESPSSASSPFNAPSETASEVSS